MLLELVTLALAVASLILHFVAPRTKTPLDDKALEYVEKAKGYLPSSK